MQYCPYSSVSAVRTIAATAFRVQVPENYIRAPPTARYVLYCRSLLCPARVCTMAIESSLLQPVWVAPSHYCPVAGPVANSLACRPARYGGDDSEI